MLRNLSEIVDFNNLELIATHLTEGFITGLHKSPFHGFSSEFNEHRLYNKGEATRHIDWKLYARSEKLFVKRYEEETNLRCSILLDISKSMTYPLGKQQNKLLFSIVCIAGLINLLRKQRDAVCLTLFDSQIRFSSDAKISSLHAKMLFSKLQSLIIDNQQVKPSTESNPQKSCISNCLHTIAETIHKRSLVILFSDLLNATDVSDLLSSLQHLRHCKHDIIVFRVLDKQTEINFELENRPHKFYDIESGKMITLNPYQFRQTYKRLANQYSENLKTHCGNFNIDFSEVDISEDFRTILVPFLLKRKK